MALLRAPVVRSEERGDRVGVETEGSDPTERVSCQKETKSNAKQPYARKKRPRKKRPTSTGINANDRGQRPPKTRLGAATPKRVSCPKETHNPWLVTSTGIPEALSDGSPALHPPHLPPDPPSSAARRTAPCFLQLLWARRSHGACRQKSGDFLSLHVCQKRPTKSTNKTKETYYIRKRDLQIQISDTCGHGGRRPPLSSW